MHDEQPVPSGGVPNAYRNAIFWKWSRTMPRRLRGPFLTLLYALGTAANPAGVLKFRDGTVIRIQDIAGATGSDEKDARRYLNAAIAAGVVAVEGERGRGRRAVYVIVLCPSPDWTAAVAVLEVSKPKPKPGRRPAPWQTENGGRSPEPQPEGSTGDQPPNPSGSSSGDQPPTEFGGPTPERFGGPTPEQPRVTQVLPQEMAGVGGSVQDAGAPETDDRPAAAPQQPRLVPPPPGGRRADRGQAKGSSSGAGQQPPLLFPVRTPPHVTEDQAQLRASATAADIRRAIAQHGQREAVRLYGFRLVAPHLPDTDGTGGTRAQ